MTFLLLKDIYNDVIRININIITTYVAVGDFTRIYISSSEKPIEVQCNALEIDQAITESLSIFKNLIKE